MSGAAESALVLDAVITVHGPRPLRREFRKQLAEAIAEDAPEATLKERHGDGGAVFDFASAAGVPFPSLVAVSVQYPDCVAVVNWRKGSAAGETTIQNGQVKEASRSPALTGRTPQWIGIAPSDDRSLRLAIALDIGRDGILGYCATASAETWFKLSGTDGHGNPELLTVGGDGDLWDERWLAGHCTAATPPVPLSTSELRTLEALAEALRAEWLWYDHAPAEQTIVERGRYAEAGRPVRAVNVKSIKLAEHAGGVISGLAQAQQWIPELLLATWARADGASDLARQHEQNDE